MFNVVANTTLFGHKLKTIFALVYLDILLKA
jgi:hypothetical protein